MDTKRTSSGLLMLCLVASTSFYLVNSEKSLKRERRGLPQGPSYHVNPSLQSTFRIKNPTSGVCLSVRTGNVVSSPCRYSDASQVWTWEATYKLKHQATGKCLKASDNNDQIYLISCSGAPEYTCTHSKKILKLRRSEKCLDITANGVVTFKSCADHSSPQQAVIYGTPFQNVCTRQKILGPRINSTSYYYFKDSLFHMNWNEKYLKLYFVYNEDLYRIFLKEHGTHGKATEAIRLHGIETAGILDKAYRQIKIRVLLVGYEIWNTGDKIIRTTAYYTLKHAFRTYSIKTLRPKYDFDTVAYLYAGKWDINAAGAGMSNMCAKRNKDEDEVFIMGKYHNTSPFNLANLLSHEIGHEFHQGHHYEPDTPCPTYRLFGARCTMGGNDWPKGFSSNFLKKIRINKYSCLDKVPTQNSIVGCGNGVLEKGEECDCGSSQSCLNSNPCCDGRICKLKKDKECSNEACCSNCKVMKDCKVNIERKTGSSGFINNPSIGNYNTHRNYLIQTSPGSKMILTLQIKRFDFREGCPYDDVEVRDGHDSGAKLLGRFCRTPTDFIESSSNMVFVTYHADNSFQSQFELSYQEKSKVLAPRTFILKHSDGRCIHYSDKDNVLQFTSTCTDEFSLTSNGHLKHVATGKCARPQTSHNGALITLTVDCSSADSRFIHTSGKSLMHLSTGKCLHPKGGWNPGEGDNLVLYSTCNQKRLAFDLQAPRTFVLKHSHGRCIRYSDKDKVLQFTSTCTDTFSWISNGHLKHVATGKCARPRSSKNAALITLTMDCSSADSRFIHTSGKSLKHISTGKCLHPKSGWYPGEGNNLVLYSTCDQKRLAFDLQYSN